MILDLLLDNFAYISETIELLRENLIIKCYKYVVVLAVN